MHYNWQNKVKNITFTRFYSDLFYFALSCCFRGEEQEQSKFYNDLKNLLQFRSSYGPVQIAS